MKKVVAILSELSGFFWGTVVVWIVGAALTITGGGSSEPLLMSIGIVLMFFVALASLYKANSSASDIRIVNREQRVLKRELKRVQIGDPRAEVSKTITVSRGGPKTVEVGQPKLRVAVLGSSQLCQRLSSSIQPIVLSPGIAHAIFSVEQPEALIVEEEVFQTGVWSLGVGDAGATRWDEVLEIYNAAVDIGALVFVLPTLEASSSIRSLRNGAIVIPPKHHWPSLSSRYSEKIENEIFDLYETLDEYSWQRSEY